jgi:hypothetical protein
MTAPARPQSPIAEVEPAVVWDPPDAGHAQAAAASLPAQINSGWRRWRLPLALIAFIVAGGVVIALIGRLISPPAPNGYLDPASQFGDGSHALADILGERGSQVVEVYSPSRALAALGAGSSSQGAGTAGPPVTLLITSPYLLTPGQQARLARSRADLFLVEPGPRALAALAPGVRVAGHAAGFGRVLVPRCNLDAARQAGSANVGGLTYSAPAHATGCYPVAGARHSVVRYTAAGRIVTIMGSGAPLTNGLLGSNGNAALMLNLLAPSRRIVWLTPEPTAVPVVSHHAGASRAAPSLIPWAAWLLVIQLGVALVLTAVWRSRRLGPLITERLPVVVRASETTEGHARLYQSRRARHRAADALRQAMLSRVLPALGLAKDAPQDAVTASLAARSRHGQAELAGIVYGAAPATDAELIELARNLDELEREVRSP